MSVLCLWLFTKKSTKVQAGDLLGSKSEVKKDIKDIKYHKVRKGITCRCGILFCLHTGVHLLNLQLFRITFQTRFDSYASRIERKSECQLHFISKILVWWCKKLLTAK